MSQPPRAVEPLLKALGADPYLTDVVLGDLAEEFSERAAFDGEVEARRWYLKEAAHAVPHLLRSAWRQLRVGDIPRLVGNSLFAWFMLVPLGSMLYIVAAGVARLLGVEWAFRPSLADGNFAALAMVGAALGGVIGGYVAAWRNARAPLIGSFAYGVVMTSINLIAGLFGSSPLATSVRIASLALLNAGAIAGGLIRVTRREAHERRAIGS